MRFFFDLHGDEVSNLLMAERVYPGTRPLKS